MVVEFTAVKLLRIWSNKTHSITVEVWCWLLIEMLSSRHLTSTIIVGKKCKKLFRNLHSITFIILWRPNSVGASHQSKVAPFAILRSRPSRALARSTPVVGLPTAAVSSASQPITEQTAQWWQRIKVDLSRPAFSPLFCYDSIVSWCGEPLSSATR